MTASTIKMRADQFLQMGEDPPGLRLELVNGEVAVTPSASPEHSHIVMRLGQILLNHVDEHGLGEVHGDVDTILDKFNVRRPDVLYFSKERVGLIGRSAMEGPPDLAVEVISQSSETTDRQDKLGEYRKAGVRHYWIIDPTARTIEAFTLRNRRYVLVGQASGEQSVTLPPFPDLTILLGKLWRPRR